MAFTEAQKVKIRKYLGFPQVFDGDNYRLEGAITVIGGDATRQALVDGYLVELDALDAAIATEGASATSYGALKRVDEVEFFAPDASTQAIDTVARARMLTGRLSQSLGVPIENDYFGRRGYGGDGWRSDAYQVGAFPIG